MRPLLLATLLALAACAPHGGGFVVATGPGAWGGPGWHGPRHHWHGPRHHWHGPRHGWHGPRWHHRHGWRDAHAWPGPHWGHRHHGWGRKW